MVANTYLYKLDVHGSQEIEHVCSIASHGLVFFADGGKQLPISLEVYQRDFSKYSSVTSPIDNKFKPFTLGGSRTGAYCVDASSQGTAVIYHGTLASISAFGSSNTQVF